MAISRVLGAVSVSAPLPCGADVENGVTLMGSPATCPMPQYHVSVQQAQGIVQYSDDVHTTPHHTTHAFPLQKHVPRAGAAPTVFEPPQTPPRSAQN